MPMTRTQRRIILCLLVLILALGAVYCSHRLTKWLAYDDEGGYLYAAWRISLGEMPYRDFLTPQLPAFLYPGALLLKLSDCSVFVARLSMSLLTLGAGLLLFMTVRRLWGDRVALLALILVLVQRDFFWAARFFRPEAPMLFWAMLGIYLFTVGYPEACRPGFWPLDDVQALWGVVGCRLGLVHPCRGGAHARLARYGDDWPASRDTLCPHHL